MGWIVHSKKAAEAAGCDLEENIVMFAITPNSVAEAYNRYRNEESEVDEDREDCRDYWGELDQEAKEQRIRAVELYIDKHMANIDENIDDCITWVENNMEQAAQDT